MDLLIKHLVGEVTEEDGLARRRGFNALEEIDQMRLCIVGEAMGYSSDIHQIVGFQNDEFSPYPSSFHARTDEVELCAFLYHVGKIRPFAFLFLVDAVEAE